MVWVPIIQYSSFNFYFRSSLFLWISGKYSTLRANQWLVSVEVRSMLSLGVDSILESIEKLVFLRFDFWVSQGRRWSMCTLFEFKTSRRHVLIGQLARVFHFIICFIILFFWGASEHHKALGQVDWGCPHDLRVRGSTPSAPPLYLFCFYFCYFPPIFISFFIWFFLPLTFMLLEIFLTQTLIIFFSPILLCFNSFHLRIFWWTYDVYNISS